MKIQTGLVTERDGLYGIVVSNCISKGEQYILYSKGRGQWIREDDLKAYVDKIYMHKKKLPHYVIENAKEIMNGNINLDDYELIYPEPKKMTIKEIEEKLGYKIEIII